MEHKTKKCNKCEETKPIADFYYDTANKCYKYECKICHNIASNKRKENRIYNINRELRRLNQIKRDAEFKEEFGHTYAMMKQMAKRALGSNLTCARCGSTEDVQIHHWDYSDLTRIEPFCRLCHRHIHVQLREDLIDA